MDEKLKNKLQIGFMDFLPLNIRNRYIYSETPVSHILKFYPNENNYLSEAQEVIDWLNKSSENKIIWYGDPDYPSFIPVERRLPYMLFYKGSFMKKNARSVSIIGTRHTDNIGYQEAFKLGLEAGINEICVVSGLAEGCDHAALTGAVAGNYPSFGVLGCGLEVDYPSLSGYLKGQMITNGGGIISRFAPNCLPYKQNFPNRNLTIAAMGNSTIVVQAPKKSGSLITCDLALQLGKDVYVSKAGVGAHWGRIGSNQLYEDGCMQIDSLSECYNCLLKAEVSKDQSGIRFGNRHYFIRSCI